MANKKIGSSTKGRACNSKTSKRVASKSETYFEKIQAALANLRNSNGSSRKSIVNYFIANYNFKDTVKAQRGLDAALKAGVKTGAFKQVKGTGTRAVYRLGNAKKTNIPKSKVKSAKQRDRISSNKRKLPANKQTVSRRTGVKKQTKENNKKTLKSGVDTKDVQSKKKTGKVQKSNTPGKTLTPKTPDRKNQQNKVPRLSDIKLVRQDSIHLQIKDHYNSLDVSDYGITPDGRILVLDTTSYKIRMFSMKGEQLYSFSVIIPAKIAVINNEEALFVQWSDHTLNIFDITSSKPVVNQTIKLNKNYKVTSVSACEDKFVLCCYEKPRSVKMIDRSGNLLWSRSQDDQGAQLFTYPDACVCFFETNKFRVVVTDTHTDNLIKLDGNTGHVIKSIPSGKGPVGLNSVGFCTDSRGFLYVCDMYKDEIRVWSPNLRNHRVLASAKSGLGKRPRFVRYNDKTGQLLVAFYSYSERNYFDCYQIVY